MNTSPPIARPLPRARSAARGALIALLSWSAGELRADRFIVPTENPPPPPPPSTSSSSGSSSPSSPTSSSYDSGSYDSGSRFITPVPGRGATVTRPDGTTVNVASTSYYDPFWGGCYYWGGNYYFWGGHYYSPHNQRYATYRDPDFYDYRSIPAANTQSPIFFPPAPPPLGAAVPPRPPSVTSIGAPEELRSYVYEPFYAPLSTRISRSDLTKKLLQRLDAYRTSRSRLQTELLQRLDDLKDADPGARAAALDTLARSQAPDLQKLEAEADDLRGDLLHGGLVGLFSGTGDWNERRRWHLGEGPLALPREQLATFEFRVIRAAAFYQDGLSPAQRRLLREIEMELQVAAFKPKDAVPDANAETFLMFSPETSRIPVSDELPPSLTLKISAYEKSKTVLKSELRDAIYSLDAASSSRRTDALRKLAATQEQSFATLEALAEEIRLEFSHLAKPPGPPAPPPFPPELGSRITRYQTEKTALQKNLQSSLDDVRRAHGDASLNIVRKETPSSGPGTLRVEVPKSDRSQAVLSAARGAIEAFNKENEKRLADLGKEREAIRVEVARFAADKEASAGKSVETLLGDFFANLQEGERWQRYRYYQIATLQPGLSPEQRRLLFEVALERLNLPLPAGEYPP